MKLSRFNSVRSWRSFVGALTCLTATTAAVALVIFPSGTPAQPDASLDSLAAWPEAARDKLTAALASRLSLQAQPNVIVYFSGLPNWDVELSSFRARSSSQLQALSPTEQLVSLRAFVHSTALNASRSAQSQAASLIAAAGVANREFVAANARWLQAPSAALLQALAALPDVASIGIDASAKLKLPMVSEADRQTAEAFEKLNSIPSNISSISADRAWTEFGAKGKGIVVAGQDTGVDWQHPALKPNYRGAQGQTVEHDYNWYDAIHLFGPRPMPLANPCGRDSSVPCDDKGHGTHTLGNAVGDDLGTNKIGVAPSATWIACRNMNEGVGTASSYLECFDFFLAPFPRGGSPRDRARPDLAPDVMVNSWSCPAEEGCTGNEFISAVRTLHAAGILVVAAAGNDGDSCSTVAKAPGFYSGELVTVGAHDRWQNDIASFSSRGPSTWNQGIGIDLVAPGNLVRSAIPAWLGQGLYDSKSGTSMATPHVAGAVAVLWSFRPSLRGQIATTMDLLRRSATGMRSAQTCGSYPGNQVPNAVFGSGMLNVHQLLKLAETL